MAIQDLLGSVLVEIIMYLILGGAAAQLLKSGWKLATTTKIDKVLVRRYTIHDILQSTGNGIGACRILLVKLHNGTGVPTPTSEIRSTVIEEFYTKDVVSVKQKWQNRDVESPMLKVLTMMGKDSTHVWENDIGDGGLKMMMAASSVKQACFCFVKQERKAMFFISVNFIGETPLSTKQKMRIDDLTNSLRQLI